MNSYIGKIFENICKQFLIKKKIISSSKIGKWWYKDKEIDIVGLNENKKIAWFFECKWSKLSYNQSLQLIKKLKEKAELVQWLNDGRREYYGLVARKIENKKSLRDEGFLIYDLDDWT